MSTTADLEQQLASPLLFDDPYPVYAQLREARPAYWSDAWGAWLITRYADVHANLRDPRRFISNGRIETSLDGLPRDVRARVQPLYDHFGTAMIHSDPPQHTRLRSLIRHAFTPRVIAALEPRVQEIVDGLLDDVQVAPEFDLVSRLAFLLPVTVIAELLGADPADRDRFKVWSDEIVAFQGVAALDPALVEVSQAALLDMKDYLRSLLARRRDDPRDDFPSQLVTAEEDGVRLTEEEMLSTCVTLLIAGHETTTSLIANAVNTLLRLDGVAERLRREPALLEPALEEVLRYESPKQRDPRLLAEDVELHGETLRAGQMAILLLGSANRDARQFDDPETFVIDRAPNRHIAFGFGIHFCLGAPLARLESRIAAVRLAERLPDIRLADHGELEWHDSLVLRGVKHLPVAL
jgi:pimeloyl-[acyl-carrier protein] synthase